jgi:hypothetical protein
MPITEIVLPVTPRGNDPADHHDDPGYGATVRTLVSAARVVPAPEPKSTGWEALAARLTVSLDDVAAIESARPIWHRLLWAGQIHVWAAPPNAGKTQLAKKAAADLAAAGLRVIYMNLDCGASELKSHAEHAERHGYSLLAPVAEGTSDADASAVIEAMQAAPDLSGVVLAIDTLKKLADLQSKRSTPAFFRQLRTLTRRGCTVLALAHTTKHKAENGDLVFDGVGDVKADCDALMYLYAVKDEATGDLTVSTRFEKERALTEDLTFRIERATRAVSLAGTYFDAQAEAALREAEAADALVIDAIRAALPANQQELVAQMKSQIGIGRRSVERVLRTYTGRHWTAERAAARHEWRYRRMVN